MIEIKCEAGKPIGVSMEGTSNVLIREGVMVVAAIVHELAHGFDREAAEMFLQVVRNVDDAGAFFVQMEAAAE